MAKHELNDVVGITELAAEHGVSRQVINNWTKRHDTFPAPLKTLAMGPLFSRSEVHVWVKGRRH